MAVRMCACAQVLSMGTEDSLANFSAASFVPLLLNLLQREWNPELMLLAARSLTHLMEALPNSQARRSTTTAPRRASLPAACGCALAPLCVSSSPVLLCLRGTTWTAAHGGVLRRGGRAVRQAHEHRVHGRGGAEPRGAGPSNSATLSPRLHKPRVHPAHHTERHHSIA